MTEKVPVVIIIYNKNHHSTSIKDILQWVVQWFLYDHVIWIINVKEKGRGSHVTLTRMLLGDSVFKILLIFLYFKKGLVNLITNNKSTKNIKTFHKKEGMRRNPLWPLFGFTLKITGFEATWLPSLEALSFLWMTDQMQVCHVRIFPALLQWSLKAEKCSTI